MKVNFRTFKISWNTYFLNDLCSTWSHGWHLVDSSIDHFAKSLSFPDVYALNLSKLLIALIGFPRLDAAFFTETAPECTRSQLYDVRHAWYMVPQGRPLDSRGLKCRLQLECHRVNWGTMICLNTKYMAVGKLKTIKHILQMYGKPCCCMLALDLSSWISFRKRTGIRDQPFERELTFTQCPILIHILSNDRRYG